MGSRNTGESLASEGYTDVQSQPPWSKAIAVDAVDILPSRGPHWTFLSHLELAAPPGNRSRWFVLCKLNMRKDPVIVRK
jgi:hypothetical protein